MSFDLPAYLHRIHLPARVTADAAWLQRLQRAHRLAIPFENLDIALGRPIAIDGARAFAKLVTGKRGGYCFEHNRLFGDALAALGFAARPLLARVWLNASAEPPLNHAVTLVTVDGAPWLADAGFGASYAPRCRWSTARSRTRPTGRAGGWRLTRRSAGSCHARGRRGRPTGAARGRVAAAIQLHPRSGRRRGAGGRQ